MIDSSKNEDMVDISYGNGENKQTDIYNSLLDPLEATPYLRCPNFR